MASTDRIQGYSGDLAIKTPCKVATTANTALAGLLTIDGVTLVAGDRVLVKDQTTTAENGIYVASAATWNRAPDFDGVNDVIKGTQVLVTDGTTNANTFFTMDAATPTSIGSSSITFASSASAASAAVTAAASASAALGSANDALGYANDAAASAAAAAIGAQITGTSTTPMSVATGTQTFVTQPGDVWVPGHTATIARTSAPVTTYMVGIVVSYNTGTGDMVVEVSRVVGTGGPFTDWTLSLAVSDSVYSAITAGTVTGTVASAATATTQSWGDATTKVATCAFVDLLRDVGPLTKTAQHTLVIGDRGQSIDITTGGIKIPTNASVAFPIGSTISAYNNSSSAQDISAVTPGTTTVRKAGTATTGTLSLLPYGVATMRKVATDVWVVSGTIA